MIRRLVLGATLALVPTVGLVSGPADGSAAWATVVEWSGSGIKETETFQVASREWRIAWETRNEAFKGAGIFQIMVHDEAGKLVTLAANKQGVGKDVSYVRSGPGKHYLMINSGNVDWTVKVEDQR
jgi:hypothetical protein